MCVYVQAYELEGQFTISLIGALMAFGLGVVWAWMHVALSFITRPQLSSLLVCWLRVIFALITTASLLIRFFLPVV